MIAFDQLEPRWKVLHIDGVSPLDKRKNLYSAPYPLTVRVSATGLWRGIAELHEKTGSDITNRDLTKMSVVAMTGVTALTRATAMRMNAHGVTYPAGDIHS